MFAQAENYETVKAKYLMGEVPINQISDAHDLYFKAKLDAMNSQYEFFKELIWVQRGLLSVNWVNATDNAKKWIKGICLLAILQAHEQQVHIRWFLDICRRAAGLGPQHEVQGRHVVLERGRQVDLQRRQSGCVRDVA